MMTQDSGMNLSKASPNDETVMNINYQSSLLFDTDDNSKTVYDPLHKSKPKRASETVWHCGRASSTPSSSNTGVTNPLAFFNIIRSNIMECCIPKQIKRNDTARTFDDDSLEEVYHETIPYEVDTPKEMAMDGMTPKTEPSTVTATAATTPSTTMTKHWMSTNTYTIEVWNAIVTVLCLNVFVQFFSGKKKK